MKRKIFTTLILIILLPFALWAQSEGELGLSNIEYLHIINTQQSLGANDTSSSSVFITQIGDNNIINSFTVSEINNSVFVQNGDQNNILVLSTAAEINQRISQTGQNNYFQSYSNNPYSTQNIKINQQGINQDITVFGDNSMSQNMTINMQGNDTSIIVRNFN